MRELWPGSIMFVSLRFLETTIDVNCIHRHAEKIVSEQIARCRGKISDVFFFNEVSLLLAFCYCFMSKT